MVKYIMCLPEENLRFHSNTHSSELGDFHIIIFLKGKLSLYSGNDTDGNKLTQFLQILSQNEISGLIYTRQEKHRIKLLISVCHLDLPYFNREPKTFTFSASFKYV